MRSSSSGLGRSFHTRTCPSRPHVAMRWYERPHDGAHEMEVMAYGAVTSSDMDPGSTGGEGSSERSVIGRREGDNCIIYHAAFQPLAKESKGKNHRITFTTPDTPLQIASTSPQYRSLHHETDHPPSASRLPAPRCTGGCGCCCCNAFATSKASAAGVPDI
jgi:hypothetical protein